MTDVSHRSRRPSGRFAPEYRREAEVSLDGPDVLEVLAKQGLEDARFKLEGRQTPPGVLGALAEQGLEGAATDDWEFRKQFIGPGPNVGLPVRTAPKAPDTWARRLGHALRGRHSA